MSIPITEILGTDSISGSRITINANFSALKSEVESIETNFGLSVVNGNIDISAAIGGQIKAKSGAFDNIILPSSGTPKISLNVGNTGAISTLTLSATTSITTPLATVSTGLTCQEATFNGSVIHNDYVDFRSGTVYQGAANVNIGSASTHVVKNSDRIILFDFLGASPDIMTISADPTLLDGHIVTFINTNIEPQGPGVLDPTLIKGGFTTIQFDLNYRSAITLMYVLADGKWIIINSSNMTFA